MLSKSDVRYLMRLLKYDHDSGGSYHMLAGTRRGHVVGKNDVNKAAPQGWNQFCGRHAEIHLLAQMDVKNQTIYIAGRKKSGVPLTTSKPCKPCMKELRAAGARKVVYFMSGEPMAEMVG